MVLSVQHHKAEKKDHYNILEQTVTSLNVCFLTTLGTSASCLAMQQQSLGVVRPSGSESWSGF